jgi:hypothetical protein
MSLLDNPGHASDHAIRRFSTFVFQIIADKPML